MLEIKLVDGSIIKFEMEYIWMDEIYKDLNNISDFIKIDDYIISKDEIVSPILKENKKQKEVIDKAIEWVKDWMHGANDWFEEDSKPSELLDILKEVE